MVRSELEITTRDGVQPAWAAHPDGAGPWPGVVMFHDGFGVRETSIAMAERLASHGFFVLLPDLFYRLAPAPPFDPKVVFGGDPAQLEPLINRVEAVGEQGPMADFARYLELLDAEPRVRGPMVGCVGYCMGGGLAMRAACTFPDRVAAAASIHGGRFVTDPSAPDEIAAKLRAHVHIAVAEIDRRHTAEISRRLEAALVRAGVPHSVELYPGSAHGFACDDLPVYDRTAAERHWARIVPLLHGALA
ncbi:MAG TPA: dienelactone hydrolase family protein [Kofleriaceae bacterium]|nr:dienelactone hydrolase family protein [Kofleriaceae bacterium]